MVEGAVVGARVYRLEVGFEEDATEGRLVFIVETTGDVDVLGKIGGIGTVDLTTYFSGGAHC